ncbi:MAG: hypothetical protein KGI27_14745, partial [Thaumarchaeota archaeon]|nr:hypothetical protein [Nitrososphaerota archaeon]
MKILHLGIILVFTIVSSIDTQVFAQVAPHIPGLDSPLHQFKSGIKIHDIRCQPVFILIIKSEDGSPACVKPQTAFRLVELGWGLEDSSTTESMNIDNTKFSANYTITYAKILNIRMDTQSL